MTPLGPEPNHTPAAEAPIEATTEAAARPPITARRCPLCPTGIMRIYSTRAMFSYQRCDNPNCNYHDKITRQFKRGPSGQRQIDQRDAENYSAR
jgi:ssDNA-binding Zn-finger/Zn-ribbon topoisomerase 1